MNNVLLYLLTVLAWGTSWFAIEFQLGDVSPTVSICYRYLIAAVALFIWCRARGLNLSFPRAAHARFALLGTLMFGLNYIAAYWAQVYISSAMNAIVFSSMLWLNILNARLWFKVRIEPHVYIGASLGMVGLAILFWPQLRDAQWGVGAPIGIMISFAGAMLASWGNMVSQSSQARGLPVVQSNAYGMLYAAVLTGLIALISGDQFRFEWTFSYVASLLYLALFASVIAFGAYLTLLGRIGAHRSGYIVVVFPVVALILSTLFEGLSLRPTVLIGVAFTLLGNVMILRGNRAAARAHA